MAIYKNPNDLANSIDDVEYDDDYERSWGPAPKTRDDARKYLRAALGNDRQNTVFEGYEDYLARVGKTSPALDDTMFAYPKGHWQNILNDEGFLDEVAGDLDDSNYDSTIEVSDEDIEKMLAQKGYTFR